MIKLTGGIVSTTLIPALDYVNAATVELNANITNLALYIQT